MKATLLSLLLMLMLLGSCTYATLTYGYYWNPLTVLTLADEALKIDDENGWTEVLSEKALCGYGTKEGMANVRSTFKKVDESSMQEPVKVSSTYLQSPGYVGYYTYYQEKYVSKGLDASGKLLLKVTILCNFGRTESSKKYLNAPLSQYSTRSCSIIDIKNSDKPLTIASYCEN